MLASTDGSLHSEKHLLAARVASTMIVLISAIQLSMSQIDTVSRDASTNVPPRFRGIQGDFVTLVFSRGVTLSGDLDLFSFGAPNRKAFFGLRGGLEYIAHGNPGGSEYGSPYFDYNLLVRATFKRRHARAELYSGYSYRTSLNGGTYPSAGQFKFGVELKWMFVDDMFGLILKLCGARGAPGHIGSSGLGIVFNMDF
jgi:hypothetical protein